MPRGIAAAWTPNIHGGVIEQWGTEYERVIPVSGRGLAIGDVVSAGGSAAWCASSSGTAGAYVLSTLSVLGQDVDPTATAPAGVSRNCWLRTCLHDFQAKRSELITRTHIPKSRRRMHITHMNEAVLGAGRGTGATKNPCGACGPAGRTPHGKSMLIPLGGAMTFEFRCFFRGVAWLPSACAELSGCAGPEPPSQPLASKSCLLPASIAPCSSLSRLRPVSPSCCPASWGTLARDRRLAATELSP